MASEDNSLPSSPPSDTKKCPGRPSQPAAESQKQRIERLQAELKQAQEALRITERRASIVGHACLRHARQNVEFSRQLAAALRAEIKSKADRATIGDLLADSASEPLPLA